MTRARLVVGLATATAIAVVALVFAGPKRALDTDRANELLFPDLLGSVNDVARLTTRHEGRELGAELVDGRWVVPERGGYPASEEAVRKIVVAMAGIRKLEAMTAMPERYHKLGVESPDAADAYSVQISLQDAEGASLGSVILGHRDPSKVDDNANEIYVRRADDPRAWLVEANVPNPTEPGDLLAVRVGNIDRSRVRQVVVHQPNGNEVVVTRDNPDQADFTLENLPDATEVLYDWAINDIGRVLTNLELVDVRPVAEVDFGNEVLSVELVTFDGLKVAMESVDTPEGQFARLRAESVAPTSSSDHEALLSVDAVTEEVASLNRQWGGWAYQFSSYRYGSFTRPMRELVKAVDAQDG